MSASASSNAESSTTANGWASSSSGRLHGREVHLGEHLLGHVHARREIAVDVPHALQVHIGADHARQLRERRLEFHRAVAGLEVGELTSVVQAGEEHLPHPRGVLPLRERLAHVVEHRRVLGHQAAQPLPGLLPRHATSLATPPHARVVPNARPSR